MLWSNSGAWKIATCKEFSNCLIFVLVHTDNSWVLCCRGRPADQLVHVNHFPRGRNHFQKAWCSLSASVYCASINITTVAHLKESIHYLIILPFVAELLAFYEYFLRQKHGIQNALGTRGPLSAWGVSIGQDVPSYGVSGIGHRPRWGC